MSFDPIHALSAHMKTYSREAKKLAKLQEKEARMTFENTTQRARDNIKAKVNWAFMELDKMRHEAHALAVEAGIADQRPDRDYEKVDYHPSPFHHYTHTPRNPRLRKAGERLTSH